MMIESLAVWPPIPAEDIDIAGPANVDRVANCANFAEMPLRGERGPRRVPEHAPGVLDRLIVRQIRQGQYGGDKMDYLGALRMFVRAVEAGSFSKAAIVANTKASTVSRAIASLEADLGVGLFHRTTRRAHLTEPGAAFYEQARSVLRSLDDARDAASAMERRPQGLIRLHVPSAFARLHIMPFVPDFLESYPDIRLDVSLTDVRVDLLAVGADLAIRIGALLDSSLIARKLAPHRRVACASPAYLARRPAITEPGDLLQHNCLIYTLQPTDHWFFRHETGVDELPEEVPVAGTLRADDSEPLRDAAVAGLGVVLLPTWLVGEDIKAGRLRRVLPEWS
ncbi:MAG TPA: LysR family transcriptional regulator, partial [Rhodopila sp.]|nr:LysR family transcriptional regulator [Rhodopila sp.]